MNPNLEAVVAAAASFIGVSLFFAFLAFTCGRRKRNRDRGVRVQTRSIANPGELSSIAVDESASFDPKLRISMDELRKATKNFHPQRIIGDGGFGLVFKARLSNGHTVAVKKLEPDAFQGFREFRAEMETLGKLQHSNIVKILGYCTSNSDRVLVYEFIQRGSLDQWLYDTASASENGDVSLSGHSVERLPLSWDTRIKIIRGVASGLAYMHGLPTPIIHRDIKASNVLLDADFEAHIADFGLARTIEASQSHVSTQFAGTMGYMPPEYKEGFTAATVKADVYSFGILMFEIATGQRPNLPVMDKGEQVGLVVWARNMVDGNRQMEMVDPAVPRDGLVKASVKEFFNIACMCTSEHARKRPEMSRVLELLESAFG
ncbi:leucine-rich repeat receptor protein kinase EMS1 [Rhodamnia argentea]|uniref:Leucine-rich repeat receptor protein kinase EMS1 n=1 Tax=Rhodamnia argentea TaxID=178133 RepID=A0A8B8QD66_9MYRT|nr:leucine-rich repeat receptor protein kinase EMS1 [Rhodamnia argentea]